MKLIVTLCVVFVLGTNVQSQPPNYCAANLCPAGRRHVACNSRRTFAPTCPGNARMVNLNPYQQNILNIHNTHRNQIAGGGLRGFQPAVRMATMMWNNELAALAAINVKQCLMKHDQCRNTRTFKTSGQNLALFTYTRAINTRSDLFLIQHRVNAWWLEYKKANMNNINLFTMSSLDSIGHFTVFVRDANPRVGCAASRWTNGKKNRFLIACNYATTNIVGKPVYVAGPAASGCKTGYNPAYRNLCSFKEAYAT